MKRRNHESRDFFCLNCGKQNMPIHRNTGRMKEAGHRKKLYCPWCKEEVNHVECRTQEDIEQFKQDFEAGLFVEEAAASIQYIKESRVDFNV